MNNRLKRGVWFIIPAIFVITILSIISSWSPEAVVVADSPPPPLPAFEGEAYDPILANVKLINQQPLSLTADMSGWNHVFSETFSAPVESTVWSAIDNDGDTNGEYYWATGVYASTNVTDTIARAISGGTDGMLLSENDPYPDNVDSWLILGPFSTEGSDRATITFDYWFDAALLDYFGVAVSTDGVNYTGTRLSGGLPGWHNVSHSLNDFVGEEKVWVAFTFTTDASGNQTNRLGAYMDNVNLYLHNALITYLPVMQKGFTPVPTNTPIPTNTPTPTATPVAGDYLDEFGNSNTGWAMRRTDMSSSNDWEVTYTTADELRLIVDETDSYIIVSPLVQAVEPPYNIEVIARFTSQSKDRHMYAIIFGADWDDGTVCPASDYSTCFNSYYWLRVEYDESIIGSPQLQYTLRRVTQHNSNNNPQSVTLIDWHDLGSASPTGWHEWDVLVEANGKITISFDDDFRGSVTDTTLLDQRYFGLMVQTNDEGDARSHFDYYKVDDVDN
jgi:hypothetical protein